MIKKMNNRPEEVLLVSGVKEIGSAVTLNRDRLALTILGIANEDYDIINQKFTEYTKDGSITDVEKPALQRELDSIDRDFQLLRRQTRDNNLGDSDEYRAYESDYNRLSELLRKIITSVGTYSAPDVYNLNTYYDEYNQSATALGNLILNSQGYNTDIDTYYARTSVSVNITPQSVAVNTQTTVSASIKYEGVEKVQDVPTSAISFGVTGLAANVPASDFVLPTGASVTITELTHSAVVTGCKTFNLKYNAIGADGITVVCQVELDSDSMPF